MFSQVILLACTADIVIADCLPLKRCRETHRESDDLST
jgi:hypothetical protein